MPSIISANRARSSAVENKPGVSRHSAHQTRARIVNYAAKRQARRGIDLGRRDTRCAAMPAA